MSVRSDVVNLTVNINGNDGLNELSKLRRNAADIRSEMDGLKKSTVEYAQKAAALKEVELKMADLRKTIGVTALNQKELVAELKRLQMMKNTVTPQTKEFFELQKQIETVTNRLYQVKNGVFGVKASFSKVKDEIKQVGMFALGYLGFEFVTDQIKSIVTNAGRLTDQLADIRRAAGLTAPEVKELQDSLRGLNTRTSNSALLDIAIVAGKLGVQKDQLAGFTKEVNKLKVVLGDELGNADEITTTLGKILNVFDGEVKAENIGKLGNAIVELANDGVASGPFITDFAQRVSGIAKAAGLSLGSTVGLGAGFEELGLRSESSSTALQKLISNIASDIPGAAKIAGVPMKEFNDLFAFKPQEALIKYAEGLTKNKKSFSEVTASFAEAGEEGARVVQTLQAIGQRGDFLRQKIELANVSIKDTTAITNAYNIKNETLGATLDKIGKKIASSFTSSGFMQGLTTAIGGFAKLLGVTEEINESLEEFHHQQEKVKRLEREMLPLIARYESLEQKARELGGTTRLSKEEQVEMNKAIQAIASGIPYAITQFDQYGKAIAISSSNAREFIRLQQLVLKEKNREAINEQKDRLEDLQQDLNDAMLNLKNAEHVMQRIKSGTEVFSASYIDFATKKLIEFGAKVGEVQDKIAGAKGLMKELSGDDLSKALDGSSKGSAFGSVSIMGESNEQAERNQKRSVDGAKKTADEKKAAYIKFLDDLEKIREQHVQAELSGSALEIQRVHAKYRELYKIAQKYGFDKVELTKLEAEEVEKILKDREKAIALDLRDAREEAIVAEIENYEKRKKIYEDFKKKLEALDDEEFEKSTKKLRDKINAELDAQEKITELKKKAMGDLLDAQYQLMTSYDNLLTMLEENSINKESENNEKRKKEFERMLQHKLISQREYDKEIKRLDDESDSRKREIEIKQLERRKKMAVMQAIMNGAEGITKIWATYAALPYIAALLTAFEVAAVGAQIATINAQEVPKAETGMKIRGKRHRDGGTFINAEDGEVILSRKTVLNNQPVVDQLLFNSQNRNGASISSTHVLPQFTSSINNGNSGFRSTSTDPYLTQALNMIAQQQARTNELLGQFPTKLKAYTVLQESQEANNTYNQIIKESGLNQ